jgi:hypothetical protein
MLKEMGKVTKAWQLKKGKASNYSAYPNLEVQPMVKEGNTFVPAPITDSPSENELSGTGGSSSNSPAPEPKIDETVTLASSSNDGENKGDDGLLESSVPSFVDMTVEQLKAYLIASGVPAGDLRGVVKADLIVQAETL